MHHEKFIYIVVSAKRTSTAMDSVPYDFLNSVAHLFSDGSLRQLRLLPSDSWRNVGSSHLGKRKNFELVVWVDSRGFLLVDPHLEVDIWDKDVNRYIGVTAFLEQFNTFTRILGISINKGHELEHNQCEISDSERALKMVLYHKIVIVSVFLDSLNFPLPEWVWKRSAKKIDIMEASCRDEFLDYHLLENEDLQVVVIWKSSFDFVYRVVDAWRFEMKQEHLAELEEYRTVLKLSDLGFSTLVRTDYSLYCGYNECFISGPSGRTVRFVVKK